MGGVKKMDSVTGQQAIGTIQKIPLETEKTPSNVQVTEHWHGLSKVSRASLCENVQNPTQHSPEQVALDGTAWTEGWTRSSWGQTGLRSASALLWFCALLSRAEALAGCGRPSRFSSWWHQKSTHDCVERLLWNSWSVLQHIHLLCSDSTETPKQRGDSMRGYTLHGQSSEGVV